MKLKLCSILTLLLLLATPAKADDQALAYIKSNGSIRCGTQANNHVLAYKDEDGNWQGFDVEVCKMLSTALFGRSDRIKMIPLDINQVANALSTNKADVMIGGLGYSASNEATSKASPVSVLYYSTQAFAAHPIKDANSMTAYKGSKVCLLKNDSNLNELKNYNQKHQLDLKFLTFDNMNKIKEAFFLKRCDLFTGDYFTVKNIVEHSPTGASKTKLLPEQIAQTPVYIYVLKDNKNLQNAIKWIINAPKLAEELNIDSKNVDIFVATKDIPTQNLLGTNPNLWKKFDLNPNWVQTYIKESGNYGEVFENTLGKNSQYKIPRGKNNLLKNNGYMMPDTFL